MNKISINLFDLLLSLANALDISSPKLVTHHQRVAYLSYTLARELNLPIEDQKDVYLAAIIHDIGALTVDERIAVINGEFNELNNHAFVGGDLVSNFAPLQKVSEIIRYHHIPWNHGQGMNYKSEEVFYTSHIINMADATCNLIKPDTNIISQMPKIIEYIDSKKGEVFDPKLVDCLKDIATNEYIWLDIMSKNPINNIHNIDNLLIHQLEIDDIVDITHLFSYLIDFRSEFTAVHSAGVANVAEHLAKLAGFSEYECKMMLIAGYLHDLGKLAIDSKILEKPGKLSEDEFNIMKSHTYYTYQLLKPVSELFIINRWASFHHEKLNGKGYPFHLDRHTLTTGSRVMAVADIFAAITENRPYREGMSKEETCRVLTTLSKDGSIDTHLVDLAIDNYSILSKIREESQKAAKLKYLEYKNF